MVFVFAINSDIKITVNILNVDQHILLNKVSSVQSLLIHNFYEPKHTPISGILN